MHIFTAIKSRALVALVVFFSKNFEHTHISKYEHMSSGSSILHGG